jgi:prevent-host-death family protein
MGTPAIGKNGSIVVSALSARANFGKLLNRVDAERRSLVIEKRGTPRAVLLSIAEQNGTSTLTSREIDRIIKAARSLKTKR